MNFTYWRLRDLLTAVLTFCLMGFTWIPTVQLNILEKSLAFCYYTTDVYANCVAMMSNASRYLFYFGCAFSFIVFCVYFYYCVFCTHITHAFMIFFCFYIMTPPPPSFFTFYKSPFNLYCDYILVPQQVYMLILYLGCLIFFIWFSTNVALGFYLVF